MHGEEDVERRPPPYGSRSRRRSEPPMSAPVEDAPEDGEDAAHRRPPTRAWAACAVHSSAAPTPRTPPPTTTTARHHGAGGVRAEDAPTSAPAEHAEATSRACRGVGHRRRDEAREREDVERRLHLRREVGPEARRRSGVRYAMKAKKMRPTARLGARLETSRPIAGADGAAWEARSSRR